MPSEAKPVGRGGGGGASFGLAHAWERPSFLRGGGSSISWLLVSKPALQGSLWRLQNDRFSLWHNKSYLFKSWDGSLAVRGRLTATVEPLRRALACLPN